MLGAIAALLALKSDFAIVGRAADGDAALELMHRLAPDILLTAVELPGRGGLDLAQSLAGGSATAVVVMTTFARPGHLARAHAAEVLGYLLKDAPVEHLGAAIRTVAAGGHFIPSDLAAAAWQIGADPLPLESATRFAWPRKACRTRTSLAGSACRPAPGATFCLTPPPKKVPNQTEAGRPARVNG